MGEANKAAKPRKPHALSREQPTDYCRRADSLLWGHLRPGCNGKISCPCPLGSAGSSRGLRRKAGCPQGQLSPETSLAPAFHTHPECRASSPAVSHLQHTQHGTCQQGSQGKSFWTPMTCSPAHPALRAGTRTQLRFGKQAGATLAASRKGLLGCSFLQQPRAHSAGCSSSCPRVFGTVREGLQQAWNPAASKRCLRAVRKQRQGSAKQCVILSRPTFCMKLDVTNIGNLR